MRLFVILSFIATTILLIAFDAKKCDHVFTNVVQPEVSAYTGSNVLTVWPSCKQESHEIICVICHHRQKQVVHYGMIGNEIGGFSFKFSDSILKSGSTNPITGRSLIGDTASKFVNAY